jgi:membrane-associated phospholipid phosphatase
VVVFVVLLIALNALYFAPQWYPFRAATEMPRLWLDDAVPFSEWWVPAYWSFYPLIVLGGVFLTTREEIRRYLAGLLGQGLVACVIFFAWPTMVSRPPVPGEAWAYHLVIALDHPLNACPSLHASFAVYCAIVLDGVLRKAGVLASLRVSVWIWVAVIFASTIGLRQHVVLDLVAGALLALAAFGFRPISRRD